VSSPTPNSDHGTSPSPSTLSHSTAHLLLTLFASFYIPIISSSPPAHLASLIAQTHTREDAFDLLGREGPDGTLLLLPESSNTLVYLTSFLKQRVMTVDQGLEGELGELFLAYPVPASIIGSS
jgi:hypothetical protein